MNAKQRSPKMMLEMTEREIMFDEAFKPYGGIYISSLHGDVPSAAVALNGLQHLIDQGKYRKNKIKGKEYPDVYINFINDLSVNARAGKWRGNYFIGINIGLFHVHRCLILRMCADPEILSLFGDVSKEIKLPKFRNVEVETLGELMAGSPQNVKLSPIDISRQHLAHFLQFTMLKLVMFHELSHIVNGHLDYVFIDKAGLYTLNESVVLQVNPVDAITNQTLEMDADCCASSHLLSETKACLEDTVHTVDIFRRFYATKNDAYTLLGFALYLNFRLFGWRILDEESARLSSHPTPGMRQLYILSHMVSWHIDRGEDVTELAETLSKAHIYVEEALTKISDMDLNVESMKSGLNLFAYSEEVAMHWESLRKDLEKFTYVNLAEFNYKKNLSR